MKITDQAKDLQGHPKYLLTATTMPNHTDSPVSGIIYCERAATMTAAHLT